MLENGVWFDLTHAVCTLNANCRRKTGAKTSTETGEISASTYPFGQLYRSKTGKKSHIPGQPPPETTFEAASKTSGCGTLSAFAGARPPLQSAEKPMPIRHCIVHLIDKKPDGTPAVLHARDSELAESAAIENMLADLNESYNAKQGKAWAVPCGVRGASFQRLAQGIPGWRHGFHRLQPRSR